MKKKSLLQIGLLTLLIMIVSGCTAEKTNYYTGTIENDHFSAMTSISGKILEVNVEEGDHIKAGTLIAKLDTKLLNIELDRLKANLKIANANLDHLFNGTRDEELNQIHQQINQQKKQIGILQEQLNHSVDSYNKSKALFESGAVSAQDLDNSKLAKDSAILKRDQANSQKKLLEEKLALALEGATDEQLEAAQAQVEMAEFAIEAVRENINNSKIEASQSGVVENVFYNLGEQYQMMSKFAKIADVDNLKVRIYVEELNMHKISVGDKIQVKVDYDPTAVIEGVVEFISSEGEFTPKNLESRENRQEVVYETRIRIAQAGSELKPGMLVDVYLEGDLNE